MAPKSVPVPMIRRVRLKNFRSIAACDVELGPLTLLVGPNGSGKSNFLHALDFVSDALTNGLATAVLHAGGIDSLMSRWALVAPDATLDLELQLNLSNNRLAAYSFRLQRTRVAGYRLIEEFGSVTQNSSRIIETQFRADDRGDVFHGSANLNDFPVRSPDPLPGQALTLPYWAGDPLLVELCHALRGMTFQSLNVDAMRRPSLPESSDRLARDGSNIGSVVGRLHHVNKLGWSPLGRIVDFLAAITPGISGVVAPTIDGYQFLRFEQQTVDGEPSVTFNASEMSDGTLRTLGVLVALYQGSIAGGSSVTLVGIEEPEIAVHPGAATAILEAMDEASMVTQVLATTHSTAMLDYEDLEPDILRGVARVNGRTVIGPIDAASRQILDEALATAGELLRMRHLTPEEPAGDRPSEISAPTPA